MCGLTAFFNITEITSSKWVKWLYSSQHQNLDGSPPRGLQSTAAGVESWKSDRLVLRDSGDICMLASLQAHVVIADALAQVVFIQLFLQEENQPLKSQNNPLHASRSSHTHTGMQRSNFFQFWHPYRFLCLGLVWLERSAN